MLRFMCCFHDLRVVSVVLFVCFSTLSFMLARQSQTDGAERLEVTDNRADMLWRLFDLRTPPLGTSRLTRAPYFGTGRNHLVERTVRLICTTKFE
jgi:hypothetical protein